MCGICGSVRAGGATDVDRATVAAMMVRLEHRGPDGEGMWSKGDAVLGHRRLAIIDLAGGYQPLLNETGEIAVVYNGEIYNYRTLRKQLAARGHVFVTASDTEVLVHGYEEWGDDLVSQLRGMFAFALWDERRRRLLLARDRLGIKPLYYFVEPGETRLLFASEIKALFEDRAVPRELNAPRLAEYLVFRSVAGDETLFAGIRELQPGTVMTIEGGRRRERRYWTPERAFRDREDAGRLLESGRALLSEAVNVRLVSDVKLGTIISGGLDSSLVSAIAAQASGATIDTFCVGFADPMYDERPFARAVAERIRSNHHEIVVSPEQIDQELEHLTWAHDEPIAHPNSVPMHLVFREAKERAGVTVLLSGEGADEVFGGYDWYTIALARQGLIRIPGLRLLSRLFPVGKLRTLNKVLSPDYLLAANAVSELATVLALTDAGNDLLNARRPLLPQRGTAADMLFVYDQRTYLLPLLQRQDRMSMAAGVEARVPLLDHPLVEWANGLRAFQKLGHRGPKALLKRIAEPWLPRAVVRRRKVGFAMPLGGWLRRGGALSHRIERLRDPESPARRVVQGHVLDRLIEEHDAGRCDHTNILWSLVSFDIWAATFLGETPRTVRLPGAATGRLLPQARMVGAP